MKYTVEEFKNDLQKLEIKDIYHKYLLGSSVWYFDEYLGFGTCKNVYDEFKAYISKKFDLPFNNIAIVGSAKLGFSLSPNTKELYGCFREGRLEKEKPSDIDLVLVSKDIFEQYWKAYQNKYYNKKIIKHFNAIKYYIFKKIITFDGFNENDEEYSLWRHRTSNFQKELQEQFKIRHTVNYFIFESWYSVEQYYISSLIKIKNMENKNG